MFPYIKSNEQSKLPTEDIQDIHLPVIRGPILPITEYSNAHIMAVTYLILFYYSQARLLIKTSKPLLIK